MVIAAQHGTMVVVIQTKDGLLVCADKRRVEKNPVRGDTFADDVVKIFEIGPSAGFFSMGATSFCIAETGETTFDADQTAREFWQKRTPTNASTLSEFQRYMVESMKAYFRRVRWDFWPDTRMVDGEPVLFDIVLSSWTRAVSGRLITNSCTGRKTASSAANLRITPASRGRSAEAKPATGFA